MTDTISTIFAALADRPAWVAWRYEGTEKRKRPIGKTNDPSTWVTLEKAGAVSRKAGVGIVLTDRELCGRLVCVDLDGCRDPESGELAAWAQDHIDKLDSYAEVSPSGTGVKVFLTATEGEFRDGKRKLSGQGFGGKQPGIELFAGEGARFVAVTGQHLDGTPQMLRTVDSRTWNGIIGADAVPTASSAEPLADRITDALTHLPADDSDVWQKVTQALRWAVQAAELDEATAHRLWVDWSKTAPEKFNERANEARWNSFRRDGSKGRAVRIGTLFYAARQHGWQGGGFRALGFPDLTDKGGLRASVPNTVVALELLDIQVSYDLFKLRESVRGHVLAEFAGGVYDNVLHRLRELVHSRFGYFPPREVMQDAVHVLGNHGRFHPVTNYLDGLEWDGIARIDHWLIEYGGAEDTEFNRAVGAIFLMAAVRRVRRPGCKFDEILVLESPQGRNKSEAVTTLAVEQDWFTDQSPLGRRDKEVIELIAGRWIIEIAELKGMRQSDIEAIKSFASRRVDSARMAYGLTTTDAPRQCVFFATTNDEQYLRDRTGNRRFWPVRIERFDLERLRADRDQLWAEAAMREQEGKDNADLIRLPEHLWEAAAEQQAERLVENPFLAILHELLGRFEEGKVRTTSLMMGLDLPPGRHSQAQIELVADAMRSLGWRKPDNKAAGCASMVACRRTAG